MERVLCWEMDAEEIQEFLPNVCRHVFTIRRIEPYNFPRAVAFSLWVDREFIFQDVRVTCVVERTLIVISGVQEIFLRTGYGGQSFLD